jgi:glycerol-3-phosphate cytidylyltransferase
MQKIEIPDDAVVGFVCGAFDLFHAGHAILLEACSSYCDYLIVGLQTDPSVDRKEKNKPIQTMFERFSQLVSHKYVDLIIPYDTEKDLINLIASIDIDFRFLGTDYLGKSFTGQELCERKGIEIIYIDRYHDFSTSELRKRIVDAGI